MRLHARCDETDPRTIARPERDGFDFTEGPVWLPEAALLFSDPNRNTIYRWSEDAGLSVFRVKSGYTGVDIGAYGQPGSNGLALDAEGRLVIDEHGNRRVTRVENNGTLTAGADRFEGRRLDSPNRLAFSPDERHLYVSNWDVQREVVMRYEIAPDATVRSGRVFVDMTTI